MQKSRALKNHMHEKKAGMEMAKKDMGANNSHMKLSKLSQMMSKLKKK